MRFEMWQMVEIKKALSVFCNNNGLELDDEMALRAADDLLKIAQQGVEGSDMMLSSLKDIPRAPRNRQPTGSG